MFPRPKHVRLVLEAYSKQPYRRQWQGFLPAFETVCHPVTRALCCGVPGATCVSCKIFPQPVHSTQGCFLVRSFAGWHYLALHRHTWASFEVRGYKILSFHVEHAETGTKLARLHINSSNQHASSYRSTWQNATNPQHRCTAWFQHHEKEFNQAIAKKSCTHTHTSSTSVETKNLVQGIMTLPSLQEE